MAGKKTAKKAQRTAASDSAANASVPVSDLPVSVRPDATAAESGRTAAAPAKKGGKAPKRTTAAGAKAPKAAKKKAAPAKKAAATKKPPAAKKPAAEAAKPKTPTTIYQFKITLRHIEPKIWRRIQIPDCDLSDLHYFIQEAFSWQNCHLHDFEIDGERYSALPPFGDDFGEDNLPAEDYLLSDLLKPSSKKVRWKYTYDYGDSWEHEILFEKIVPADAKVKYPRCLEGERAAPPEDCGGPYGYPDFVEAITNRKSPRHKELREWVGPFDPEEFDAAETTKWLQASAKDM